MESHDDVETVLRALLDEIGTRRDGIARRLAVTPAGTHPTWIARAEGKDDGLLVAEALIERALASLRA